MTKRKLSSTEIKDIICEYETLKASIDLLKSRKSTMPQNELSERLRLTGEIRTLEQRFQIVAASYHDLPDSDSDYAKRRKISELMKGQTQMCVYFQNKENIKNTNQQPEVAANPSI
ncbi:MAG: hypothetical protein V4496_01045 [Pseudomonadota bacterium]